MTRRQELLLTQLAEEAAEVIQAVAKIQRFGLEDVYEGKTNQERLQEEVLDFFALRKLLEDEDILNTTGMSFNHKLEKVEKWLAYSMEGPRTNVTTKADLITIEEHRKNIAAQVLGNEGFRPMIGGKEVG